MATLEDKILGVKLHNYCSSSEESDGDSDGEDNSKKTTKEPEGASLPEPNKWEGMLIIANRLYSAGAVCKLWIFCKIRRCWILNDALLFI